MKANIPKYRAYIKETGEMIEVSVLNIAKKKVECVVETMDSAGYSSETRVFSFDDIELMQSTVEFEGVYDMIDEHIYEDDLVLVPEHYSGDLTIKEYVGRVVFETGEFYIKSKKHEYQGLFDDGITPDILKIIGNVYQHPELLEN